MCGIWGIFGSEADVHEQVPACFKIAHRGPDCFRFENVNHFANCAFGFHRLAIVDDLNGMQPIRIVSLPHIWMIYNGEIYNYKELAVKFNFNYLTNCDGESLIHLYNKGGIEFMCENLYGVFAFILFDSNLKRVYTGRDTYGVRPVFRSFTESGTLTICSEAKGLQQLQLNNQKPRISQIKPGSFEEFSLEPAGINKMYKATFVREYRFHAIGNPPKYDVNVQLVPDNVYENIRNCLANAVKKRLMGERRIGCLLSGGLDSSLITGLLVQEARKAGIKYPIQTFSIGMGEESPDVLAARKVAAHLGTEHHEVTFTEQDAIDAVRPVIKALESYDVTTIRASIGMYLLSKYIREKTDTVVIFSGEGSDEVCQGKNVADLQSSLAKEQASGRDLSSLKKKLESDLAYAKKESDELRNRLNQTETANRGKDNQINSCHDEIANLNGRIYDLNKNKKQLEDLISLLQEQLRQEQERSNALENSKRRVEAMLDETEANLEKEKREKINLDKLKRQLEGVLRNANAQIENTERINVELEALVKRRETEINSLSSELEEERASVVKASKNSKSLQQRLHEIEDEIQNERNARNKFEKQRNELARELEELTRELEESNNAKAILNESRKKCEFELNRLRRDLDDMNKNHESSFAQLRKKHEDAVSDMSGQIDSLIKARNKLEKEKLSILSEADQARISTRHLDKDEIFQIEMQKQVALKHRFKKE